jgi:serine/threonine-protein kinase
MAEQWWYINAAGLIEGPLPVAELRARAASGELAPTDSVSSDHATWVPASAVPDLTFPPRPRRPMIETVVSPGIGGTRQTVETTPAPVVPTPADVAVEGYDIIQTLGAGAMGVVYKARQQKLNREVALKTMYLPEGPGGAHAADAARERFRKEAQALAQLQHPNIVAVYDYGMCQRPVGQAFFAMELLDGEDFGAKLDRVGKVDEKTAWLVVRQAAAALAHAHTHGLVHRDVKPANLFLVPVPTGVRVIPQEVGFVKVTDFGLAMSQSLGELSPSNSAVVAGTPAYMAPEQFDGSVDLRADIYGLGATVYHALTGEPPFDGRSLWEVGMRKKDGPPPRLSPDVASAETADLVDAMLAIDPAVRPQTYNELIDRIEKLSFMKPPAEECVIPARVFAPPPPPPPMPEPKPPGDVVPAPVAVTPAPVAVTPPPPEPLAETLVATPTLAAAPPAPDVSHVTWIYGLAVAAAVSVASVVAVWLFRGPAATNVVLPSTAASAEKEKEKGKPREKVDGPPLGHQVLFVPGKLGRWKGDGGEWDIVKDSEGVGALTGFGGAVRPFDFAVPARFRVAIALDPTDATEVDLVVATGVPPSRTRWLIRVEKAAKGGGTVRFGKQVGSTPFEPEPVSVPLPAELGRKSSYLEFGYERADGLLVARFGGTVLGRVPDAALQTTELRIHTTGTVRINEATLTDLGPKN